MMADIVASIPVGPLLLAVGGIALLAVLSKTALRSLVVGNLRKSGGRDLLVMTVVVRLRGAAAALLAVVDGGGFALLAMTGGALLAVEEPKEGATLESPDKPDRSKASGAETVVALGVTFGFVGFGNNIFSFAITFSLTFFVVLLHNNHKRTTNPSALQRYPNAQIPTKGSKMSP